MGRTEKWLTVTRLNSLGFNSLYGQHGIKLGSRVTDGPVGVIGRGVEIFLNKADLNWLVAYLAADNYWAAKLKAVLAERESLLKEAENAPIARRLRITGRLSDQLAEVLRHEEEK